MDDELQSLLKEYRSYFAKCEYYLKQFEHLEDVFDIQPLNQIRYGGRDLIEGLLNSKEDKEYNKIKIIEAIRHVRRAMYDMLEIIIAFYRNRLKKFEADYEGIDVSSVIPNFYADAIEIKTEGSNIIDRNSSESYDNKEINQMDNFVKKLETFDDILKKSRGTINSIIEKKLRARRFPRILAIIAILISLSTFSLLLIKWTFYNQ